LAPVWSWTTIDMALLKGKIIELKDLGVDRIILHNINRIHKDFINDYKV
jgi:hypothetical protein